MARRNELPNPAEPKPATRQRQQRKPDSESVTSVNYRKTEKDVAKLIDCLAEWTRDLQAARSAAPDVSPHRHRSRSEARSVISTVSPAPSYPRGNPLTESMEFSDRDGAVWLVYIEGAPRPPGWYLESGTALPDRHLRFDSASESRFTSHLPAGSPFLAEARLQSLLDEAKPDPPLTMTTGSPAPALSSPKDQAIEWSTGAVEAGREAIAEWSGQWQQTASRMGALRRHLHELMSGATNTMHGMVEGLLRHRPARP
jgi:hypothetical protein